MTTKTILAVACATIWTVACGGDDTPSTPTPSAKPSSLSKAYASNCATCHGDEGQGSTTYPSLPGGKTESAFVATVRAGVGTMPAFKTSQISDADLKSDYTWLTTKH